MIRANAEWPVESPSTDVVSVATLTEETTMTIPTPSPAPRHDISGTRGLATEPPSLRLVATGAESPAACERELLAFDPDDDLQSIVPMPPSIPVAIRAAITRAVGEQFEGAEDLDTWLHSPHALLGGATPFERVVEGDGAAVLRAVGVVGEVGPTRPASRGRQRQHPDCAMQARGAGANRRVVR